MTSRDTSSRANHSPNTRRVIRLDVGGDDRPDSLAITTGSGGSGLPFGWHCSSPRACSLQEAEVQYKKRRWGPRSAGIPQPQRDPSLLVSECLGGSLPPLRVTDMVRDQARDWGADAVLLTPNLTHELPLELVPWGQTNDPGPTVIRYTSGSSSKPLVPDDDVRAFVACCHDQLVASKAEVCAAWGQSIRADRILFAPSLDRLCAALEEHEANVLIYMGHTDIPAATSENQGAFLQFDQRPSDETQQATSQAYVKIAGEPVKCVAERLSSLRRLKAVVLLGCQTWPSAADLFIHAGIPVVVGTHWEIDFGDDRGRWIAGAAAFVDKLRSSGGIDQAYAAMRTRIAADQSAFQGSCLAMHVHLRGEPHDPAEPCLRFIANDEDLRHRIKYARTVAKATSGIKRQDEVRTAGRAQSSALAAASAFIERQLFQQIHRPARERRDRWPRVDAPPGTEPQSFSREPASEQEPQVEVRNENLDGFIRRLTEPCDPPSSRRGERTVSSKPKQIGLVGPFGLGKTMLMRRVAHELAERFLDNPRSDELQPVYVELWRLDDEADQQAPLTSELIQTVAKKSLGGTTDSIEVPHPQRDRVVFLCDGLDEAMPLADALRAAFCDEQGCMAQHPSLVSGRLEVLTHPDSAKLPHFRKGDAAQPEDAYVELRPFAPTDSRALVLRLLSHQSTSDSASQIPKATQRLLTALNLSDTGGESWEGPLGDLLSNPYFVDLTCAVASVPGSFEAICRAQTATEIMELALPRCIQRRTLAGNPPVPYLSTALLTPLAAIAFEIRVQRTAAWCAGPEAERAWQGIAESRAREVVRDSLKTMKLTAEYGSLPKLQEWCKQIDRPQWCSMREEQQVINLLCEFSGMIRRRHPGNHPTDSNGFIEAHDQRMAEFLPAWHLARLVQGPRVDGLTDDEQNMPQINLYRSLAKKHGVIKGWDSPVVTDPGFNDLYPDRKESILQYLSRVCWDQRGWEWPIMYLAGLLEDPRPLLQELANG